jgi:undecaprenyl-diphosphatase
MDGTLLHALNDFASHHDGFEDALSLYERLAQVLFMALLAGLVLAGGHRLRRAAVAGGLAAAVALACAQVLARLVDRPRPFVADPSRVHLFAAHAADAGFPSDHATAAFAIAVALVLRDRRWGAATLVLATVLAVGRVAIGVHYPSDVLAGAALGTLIALLLYLPAVRGRIDGLTDRGGTLLDRIVPRRTGLRALRRTDDAPRDVATAAAAVVLLAAYLVARRSATAARLHRAEPA